MNYWLFVTTAENWKIITEKSFIGISKRNERAVSRVKIGDKCLIYIKRWLEGGDYEGPLVIGEYQIESGIYVDNTRVFDSPNTSQKEVFPLRLKLKRVGQPADPVPFRPMIPKLSFIINKKKWGSSLQGRGLINISERDYLTVVSFLRPNRLTG
jgi:predicted RNA-binding protein